MAVGLLIMPNIKAIIAITNNTCIMLPTEYTNTPNAQPISKITAMIYNNEFMVMFFNLINDFHRYNYNIAACRMF